MSFRLTPFSTPSGGNENLVIMRNVRSFLLNFMFFLYFYRWVERSYEGIASWWRSTPDKCGRTATCHRIQFSIAGGECRGTESSQHSIDSSYREWRYDLATVSSASTLPHPDFIREFSLLDCSFFSLFLSNKQERNVLLFSRRL